MCRFPIFLFSPLTSTSLVTVRIPSLLPAPFSRIPIFYRQVFLFHNLSLALSLSVSIFYNFFFLLFQTRCPFSRWPLKEMASAFDLTHTDFVSTRKTRTRPGSASRLTTHHALPRGCLPIVWLSTFMPPSHHYCSHKR